ncbi:MAG: DUF835 domain-containing protein [Thermoplasmata archaeon]
MDEKDKIELYLKAYEEGQEDAWSEIESMVSKYEGWELRSRVESKIGILQREIASKRSELKENPEMLSIETEGTTEESDEEKMSLPWNKGDAYLFIEKKPQNSVDELSKVMREGVKALIIVRTSPDKIIEQYDIPVNGSKLIWLTRSKGKESELDLNMIKISPSDLSGLSNEIGGYMKQNPNGVIFLSGIALMTNYNEESKVLKLLNFSKDKVTEHEGCLVSSISGDALEEKLLEKIKGEFDRTFRE